MISRRLADGQAEAHSPTQIPPTRCNSQASYARSFGLQGVASAGPRIATPAVGEAFDLLEIRVDPDPTEGTSK